MLIVSKPLPQYLSFDAGLTFGVPPLGGQRVLRSEPPKGGTPNPEWSGQPEEFRHLVAGTRPVQEIQCEVQEATMV